MFLPRGFSCHTGTMDCIRRIIRFYPFGAFETELYRLTFVRLSLLVRLNHNGLSQMILHRPCRVSPFHVLATYLGLLVSLTVPIGMFAQTSVQPGTFGVKLSGFENLLGGGAPSGPAQRLGVPPQS